MQVLELSFALCWQWFIYWPCKLLSSPLHCAGSGSSTGRVIKAHERPLMLGSERRACAALCSVSACIQQRLTSTRSSGTTPVHDFAGDRILVLCAPEDMWMPLWKFDQMLKSCPGIQVLP